MKAVIYEHYGPPEVLQWQEVARPTPKDHEVLIKVHASTVTAGDWRVRSLTMPRGFGLISRLVLGLRKPRQAILGVELAGTVVALGSKVNQFKVGDQVFGMDGAHMGCYAEYKCMPQDGALALKPASLSFEEAAALSFGGTTALDFFRRANLKSGETVLVNGASGGVGTAAVQLAKHFGAEVTAVCSGANAALVRSLGADHVIDYAKQDFTTNGQTYELIVDTAGTAGFSRCKGSLADKGRLLLVLGGLAELLQAPWVGLSSGKKIIAGPATERAQDVRLLAELAGAGKFKPVIDRRYPVAQIVEAHRYVDTGRKRGNVVITWDTLAPDGQSGLADAVQLVAPLPSSMPGQSDAPAR
ncbi:NAD(P)-dependent alcohol dehydrogenase [Rhodoferax sp.]|uniref:NAD(P)-dependent alcohol dehydrogenase n=1 Tax=Rhodoferax sp. TaxID=50421 RepID=UPI0027713EB7|nr:NAD(P)-dependent alcohol dehydrogenase [Rhodoferax sp.]